MIVYGSQETGTNVSVSFGLDISDGEWHRLGFSIKGDAVTLILDCNYQLTKELKRNLSAPISTSGIIIVGEKLYDKNLYFVSVTLYEETRRFKRLKIDRIYF